MTTSITRSFVALGSNMSQGPASSCRTVLAAMARLRSLGVLTKSALYKSHAYPKNSGPDFVNAVVGIETTLRPAALLTKLHNLEDTLGRKRGTRWGPRTLDLDLLAWGDAVLPDAATQDAWRALPLDRQMRRVPETLILPHPRLQDRAFVLVPWADIAPDWRHPRTGRSVAAMLADLPAADLDGLRRL